MCQLRVFFCLSLSLLAGVQGRPHFLYYREDWKLGDKVAQASFEYIAHDVFNTSSPKCTSRDGHKVRCFFATNSSTVGYAIISKKKLQGVWDYGGNVKDQPQVADFGFEGSFAFFIDDSHHIVAVGIETNTTFDHTPAIVSPVLFSEAPTCVPLEEGTELFCLARGMNGDAKSFRFRNGTWEEPIKIGPNTNGPIGCAVNPIARVIQCWASYGKNNAFSERWWSLHGEVVTSTWRSFGQQSRGRPCVKLVGTVAFPRALADDDDRMVDPFRRFFGNVVFSEPECTSANSHTYDCFVLTSSGSLERMVQYLGVLYLRRASDWKGHYGRYWNLRFKGNPSCLYLTDDQHYHCYITGKNGTLYEGVYEVVDPRPRSIASSAQVTF